MNPLPARSAATDKPNHVIDAGSAISTAPGVLDNRWDNTSNPATVGAT